MAAKLKYGYPPVAERESYSRWLQMKQRCFNENSTGYMRWGGRGITVCERWLDYGNFVADMGEPPPGLSIERQDNDGNYAPGNCIWATSKVQAINQSKPNISNQVKAGMAAGAAAGRHAGRPQKVNDDAIKVILALGLTTIESARRAGLTKSQFIRRRRLIEEGESNG